MIRLPSSEPVCFAALDVLGVAEELAERVLHAAAGRLDTAAMPPALSGLPVTQAEALMSVVFIRRYWSTIQAISRSPVPMSGAGTFWLGLIRSRLQSSKAKRRVICSISCSFHSRGSILRPPLEPPNGTSTSAHL